MDLPEGMVCTAVENSYVFAAWRAVLLIKDSNGNMAQKETTGTIKQSLWHCLTGKSMCCNVPTQNIMKLEKQEHIYCFGS